MKDKVFELLKQIIDLDEWKFIHLRVGTPSGTTEFFFANPNQPKETEKTDKEKQEEFIKENPNGLIVDDNGIRAD